MKLLMRQRSLGLALGERSAQVAEAVRVGSRRKVVRTASLVYPDGVSLDRPEVLGSALHDLLRAQGIRPGRVVIGLSARRLLARAVDRLENLEAALAVDLKDVAHDLVRIPAPTDGAPRLAVAALRRTLDLTLQTIQAAGLRPRAVTSTALALLRTEARPEPGLHVAAAAGVQDLVVSDGGAVVSLRPIRHLGGGWLSPDLAGELRRAVLEAVPAGRAHGQTAGWVWGASEAASADLAELSRLTGVEWKVRRPGALTGWASPLEGVDAAVWPASALALCGLEPAALPLDLLNGAPGATAAAGPSRKTISTALAVACGLAVVGGLGWYDLSSRAAESALLTQKIEESAPDRAQAEKYVEAARYGLRWFDARPIYLECLREVTLAFPEEGGAWATGVTLKDTGLASVTCKATDTQTAFAVIDRMKQNAAFRDVKLVDLRETAGGSSEVAFSFAFRWVGI